MNQIVEVMLVDNKVKRTEEGNLTEATRQALVAWREVNSTRDSNKCFLMVGLP